MAVGDKTMFSRIIPREKLRKVIISFNNSFSNFLNSDNEQYNVVLRKYPQDPDEPMVTTLDGILYTKKEIKAINDFLEYLLKYHK